MVSLNFRLNRQANGRTQLGESPFWDPETGDIWWVDITGEQILRMDAQAGDIQCWQTPEIPGFAVLMASGRPAVGMQTGIFSFDPHAASFELLVSFDRAGHRFNDATVDRLGCLWTSTMALDAQPGCAAIQLVTDHLALATVVSGLTIPNGLALDLERGRLFYSDSHPAVQNIWVRQIRPDPPTLGEPRLFATTNNLKGRPDGAALDERGRFWIAGVDGAELYVFDPDGQLDATVSVPFPAPTKISFLGSEGRSIAVTSKSTGEEGGYIAVAEIPDEFPPGITQPYWNAGP